MTLSFRLWVRVAPGRIPQPNREAAGMKDTKCLVRGCNLYKTTTPDFSIGVNAIASFL